MSSYLDQIEEQLTELTERGAHRRLRARVGVPGPPRGPRGPRRRSEALAFLAAAVVAAAVVAIIVLNVGTGTPHRTSSPASSAGTTSSTTSTSTTTSRRTSTVPNPVPGATGIPIPANFSAQSFTAISELTWWILGGAPCTFAGEKPPCGELLRTTDGGRSFVGIQAPHATLSRLDATAGYSEIRFADEKNGFAYGPDLYVTHNAGTTWTHLDVGGRVSDLAISSGEAYAIVTSAAGASGRLMHSAVSQDQWTPLPAAGEVSGGLWVEGANVLVQSGSDGPGPNLLVSHNSGASFATYPAPSPGLPCAFEGAASPDAWAHCVTGTESGVWLTHDGGANFSSAEPTSEHLMLSNSAVFGAASGTTAVVGSQQLYRTGDAGQTWTPVGPAGIAEWTYIGFTDATHGVAIGYAGSIASGNQRLYYTTDAGQSYHLVSLP